MIQGNRIRQLREQRALSQDALGKLVAKDAHYISKVERGVLRSMTTTTLERLATTFEVSTDYLLGCAEGLIVPPQARTDTPAGRTEVTAPPATRPTHARPASPEPVRTPIPVLPPEPSRHPLLCPQCVLSLVPLPEGQGFLCPACRYAVAGEEAT
jgi:transcriptional regulator with XRE-family HTH domain